MTIRLHIHGLAGFELPTIDPPCCMGAAARGPDACTCWEIVYDRKQHFTPQSREEPAQRERMCRDCAFRQDSPERTGDERYEYSGDGELEDLVHSDEMFACHEGMRRIVAWVHPSGVRVDAPPGFYDPGLHTRWRRRPGADWSTEEDVALKADGSPADLCAGLRAARERVR